MSLWFDTTGVWGWNRPQLTGIQRVVGSTLEELLKAGADVRLFRLDESSRTLCEVAPEELPAIVLQSRAPRAGNGATSAPAEQIPDRGGQQNFISVAFRRGPPNVRDAIENYRFSQQALRYALDSWMADGSGRTSRAAQANGAAPAQVLSADERLFKAGDVCLSMCLTTERQGYWEAVAANKPKDVPFLQLLHDVELIMAPQWVPSHWAAVFDAWLQKAVAHSQELLTVSRFQQDEIRRYLHSRHHPDIPVHVVTPGDNPAPLNMTCDPSGRIAALLQRPFVLCVSGFYPRKNHAALYYVWHRLSATLGKDCPQLVLVGERPRMPVSALSQMMRDPLTKDRISIFHDIKDEELIHLYGAALFTVYPSFYEGWGLPVSESLRFGRYCIASSAASLPEVGGDLVDYFDPFDPMELHAKALRAIRDPDYVRAREAAVRQYYVPRSWADTARQLLAAVDEAHSRHKLNEQQIAGDARFAGRP